MNPAVAQERSGWRDFVLSQRHRTWGFDCPCLDIDFLVVEYDQGRVVCLVEYKHEIARPHSIGHPSFQALADLADRARIPFFECRYATDLSWFEVTPINGFAIRKFHPGRRCSEREWVTLLYSMRGRPIPFDVSNFLDSEEWRRTPSSF